MVERPLKRPIVIEMVLLSVTRVSIDTSMPSPAPTSFQSVRDTQEQILNANPPYPGVVRALLFPTDVSQPMVVSAPLRYGSSFQVGETTTLKDLDLSMWLDMGFSAAASTVDLNQVSITVDRFPADSPFLLRHAFTVVVCTQLHNLAELDEDHYIVNRMINETLPALVLPWRGNVLVFKHGNDRNPDNTAIADIDISEHHFTSKSVTDGELQDCFARLRRPLVILRVPILSLEMPFSTANRFFLCASLLQAMFPSLRFDDFVSCSHVTRTTRAVSQTALESRASRLLGGIVASPESNAAQRRIAFASVMDVLQRTQSIVVGSAVLALITLAGEEAIPVIDNLNIVCPFSEFKLWALLMDALGYKHLKEDSVADYLAITCVSYHVFAKQLTSRREGLLGWPAGPHHAVSFSMIDGKKPHLHELVQQRLTNSHWQQPCNKWCPRFLHQTKGLPGVGIFHWNLVSRTRMPHLGQLPETQFPCSGGLWVAVPHPTWTPDNINVVVPRGNASDVKEFLTTRDWSVEYRPVRETCIRQVHNFSAVIATTTGASFVSFVNEKKTLRVTITEAVESHIFRVVACSQHTLQMVVLTSTVLMHKQANSNLEAPCDPNCIGGLRRLRGARGIALFDYRVEGRSDCVGRDAYDGFSADEYRMGWVFGTCRNKHCGHFGKTVTVL
ncbi:hypothetical protein B0H13DRAFT_1870710 [Mycena leptocephala]|nr:hypothetical protein B0H13DRAFT_1870710 [Mycena leptocephala]